MKWLEQSSQVAVVVIVIIIAIISKALLLTATTNCNCNCKTRIGDLSHCDASVLPEYYCFVKTITSKMSAPNLAETSASIAKTMADLATQVSIAQQNNVALSTATSNALKDAVGQVTTICKGFDTLVHQLHNYDKNHDIPPILRKHNVLASLDSAAAAMSMQLVFKTDARQLLLTKALRAVNDCQQAVRLCLGTAAGSSASSASSSLSSSSTAYSQSGAVKPLLPVTKTHAEQAGVNVNSSMSAQSCNIVLPQGELKTTNTSARTTTTAAPAKFCSNCGTKSEGGKFCADCGQAL